MAEVIYATPNMMTKARNTQGEREERIVEIYATTESLGEQHQDYVGTEETSNTLGTVRSQQPDPVSPPQWPIRAVVVLLGLLSVVLLAGILGLVVQHKIVMDMGRDVEQLVQRLKNVTEQRDSLLRKQDCQSGWDDFGHKCYLLSKVLGSWNKSRKNCVSHGADLVVVDSKEEMDFISSRYNGNNWLGATDEASERLWRWVDGTVLSVDNPSWSTGKPDGGKEKNCLRRIGEETNFKWTDESCEATNLGICELNLMK
ncbi:C-type lectin domain family 4 member C-like [Gadus macrocephalus]|uniref:C-type lectin domain family 4 member C-like n=1 Tax=Gadus macrocephalus TaxID=80720 RepID=UPI0028CB37B5|nr:C-type lectin domain family 4 member C-like [Gadus macrocephalus]